MGKKQTMTTPYSTLAAKKYNPSNPYLMISELVDNSISSWLENQTTQLTVEVELDMENNVITVTDNANGMSEQQLEDSVRLNKEKSGNVLNMFGVGLKNAAFWFGQDLYIKSTKGNKTFQTEIIISEVKSLSDPVEWEVNKSKKTLERGTIIEIKNVYDDRKFTPKDVEDLAKSISIKYKKYLQRGIRISIHANWEGKDDADYDLKSEIIYAQMVDEDDVENAIKVIRKEYKNHKPLILKKIDEIAIEFVRAGKALEFEFPIRIKGTETTSETILTIGVQRESKSYDALYGITTYQKDRAINFGKNALSLGDKVRGDIKRVYGSIELGELFRPDNNKMDFQFGMQKQEFLAMIQKIGDDIEPLATAMKVLYSKRQIVKVGNTKVQGEKVENLVDSKLQQNITFKMEKERGVFTFNFEDEMLSFNVIEKAFEDKKSNTNFINTKSNPKTPNSYDIEFNINHPIWKPLMTASTEGGANKIDVKSVIYPLVAIIGISEFAIKTQKLAELTGGEFDPTRFTKILSAVAKRTITNG